MTVAQLIDLLFDSGVDADAEIVFRGPDDREIEIEEYEQYDHWHNDEHGFRKCRKVLLVEFVYPSQD